MKRLVVLVEVAYQLGIGKAPVSFPRPTTSIRSSEEPHMWNLLCWVIHNVRRRREYHLEPIYAAPVPVRQISHRFCDVEKAVQVQS